MYFMGTQLVEYFQFWIIHVTFPIILLFLFHVDILSLKSDGKLLEHKPFHILFLQNVLSALEVPTVQ